MGKSPLISIIVPIYNGERYLEACIESICKQSYTHWELVLVNDGSIDRSALICQRYVNEDERILYVSQENAGVVEARKTGFSISRGDYILFVDSDDYIRSDTLAKLTETLGDEYYDFIAFQYSTDKEGSIKKTPIRPTVGVYNRADIVSLLKDKALYNEQVGRAEINPYISFKLFARSAASVAIDVPGAIWYEEDLLGILKVLYEAERIKVVDDYFHYYREHSNQVTKQFYFTFWNNFEAWMKEVRKIDKANYFSEQLKHRLIMTLLDCIYKPIKAKSDYKKTLAFWEEIRRAPLFKELWELDIEERNRLFAAHSKSKRLVLLKENKLKRLYLECYMKYKGKELEQSVKRFRK